MRQFLEIIFFTPYITRAKIAVLMAVTVTATFFEGFSVAMLYPVMDFIEKGKDFNALAGTSRMWSEIVRVFDFLRIPKNLIALMVLVFGLLMVRQLFNYWKATYGAWITENIGNDIRGTGFGWLAEADIPFYDRHAVGELTNAIVGVDGARASNCIIAFFSVISSSMMMLIYIIILLIFSFQMTLLAACIIGCVGFVLKSRYTKTSEIGTEVSRFNKTISSAIVERLNGIRLIKLSAKEKDETRKIKALSEEIQLNNYHISKIRAKMEFTIDPLIILAGFIIIYFSSEVFHMSLAKIGIFVFVLMRLMPYARTTFKTSQSLLGYSGSLKRVRDLLEQAQKARVICGGAIETLDMERGIRFEGITFSYHQEDGPVLQDLHITIPAGKMTALVGRSGAGKSTLVDLIPRLRVPSGGRITIDDIPIEDFDLRTLRRAIAFVTQEGFLFNDTIENNIRYARSQASFEEVVKMAETAYADHFIRAFPKGYKTVVGERGVKLSGGQRQRIILARALLQRASILILDEPTSSLDSESEKYIQKAMEGIRNSKGITMIIIAHRLSTIKSADQIIVLDKGRVIEHGDHGQLIHEDKWYADMVKIQMSG